MSKKIRVAVAGVGNCASALVQGVIKSKEDGDLEGLSSLNWEGIGLPILSS